MWSSSRTEARALAARALVLAALAAMLAGCSDIYFDRRETVALGADDHIASNRIAQIIDPWPADVGKREIAFNGQKMQSAIERYRTNRVTRPTSLETSAAYRQTDEPTADPNSTGQAASTPAAPVK